MKRPSTAQAKVLDRLTDGTTIKTMAGLSWTGWYSNSREIGEWISFNTFHALRARGWIETIIHDWRGDTYRISEAGRKALEDT